jgi:hypothetical protein
VQHLRNNQILPNEDTNMTFTKAILAAALPLAFATVAMADEIMVSPQSAGNSVTVDSVTIAHDGWLVIHEIRDGKPVVPASIGHVAVKAGTTENVTVSLSKDVAAGTKVLTMLHVDKGTLNVYEFPGADHPVKQDGKPVVKPMAIN